MQPIYLILKDNDIIKKPTLTKKRALNEAFKWIARKISTENLTRFIIFIDNLDTFVFEEFSETGISEKNMLELKSNGFTHLSQTIQIDLIVFDDVEEGIAELIQLHHPVLTINPNESMLNSLEIFHFNFGLNPSIDRRKGDIFIVAEKKKKYLEKWIDKFNAINFCDVNF